MLYKDLLTKYYNYIRTYKIVNLNKYVPVCSAIYKELDKEKIEGVSYCLPLIYRDYLHAKYFADPKAKIEDISKDKYSKGKSILILPPYTEEQKILFNVPLRNKLVGIIGEKTANILLGNIVKPLSVLYNTVYEIEDIFYLQKDMFEPTPKFRMCCFIAKKKKSIDIDAFRKFIIKYFDEKKEFDEYLKEFKS